MGDADRELGDDDRAIARRLLFAAVALLAGLGVLAETAEHGIGISPDSVDYIRQARHLAEPGGLALLGSGSAFVSQPPAYPLLLAGLAKATGVDPVRVVPALNAVLLALSCTLACTLLVAGAGRSRSPWVLAFALVSLVTARSLHDVFGMAWSEPLFILLSIGIVAALARHLRTGDRRALWLASALSVLAVGTRYGGVAFIAAGALSVLVAAPGGVRERVRSAFGFAVLPAAIFAGWALRNHLVSGTLLGERNPALHTLGENTARFVAIAQAHWLPATEEIGVAAKLGAAFALAGALVWLVAPRGSVFVAKLAADRAALVPCATFALIYAVFTIVTSSLVAYDPIDFRLFAPAFVPLWAVVVLVFDAVLRMDASRGRTLAVVAVLAALLIAPIRQFAADSAEWREHGRQLARAEWTGSPTVAWLQEWPGLRGERPVYSNMRAAIHWFAGADARNVPSRTPCAGTTGDAARTCFLDHADPALFDAWWVEFAAARHPNQYALDEIAPWVELETVAELADGRVVRIRGPRRPPG